MSILCSKLRAEHVMIGLRADTKEEVITSLSRMLSDIHNLDKSELIIQEVLEREKMTPTFLGFDCSIPHAHIDVLDETYIVAANLAQKVSFASEGADTSIVFLIVGPERHAPLHLRLLSTIARLLHNPETRRRLAACSEAREFVSILCPEER